ncbi:uncharacterized protein BDZ99DRAFT_564939 [Mytilinidion resinicola]|uniref:Atos-like conserved domain-containing protein n=1 Tax=Mytilinidion resinicola TaxID=574789 RepID=A0A6A6Z7Y0_9PEZI|nr:uncharacterized protein BDZ99DRAFT_564939 [Mytilinidion resinicola]KAF2817146.1 hypothetical protein BDZ99DRAFT_564939 [Mytilinidion resinicola]
MPIFHDLDDSPSNAPSSRPTSSPRTGIQGANDPAIASRAGFFDKTLPEDATSSSSHPDVLSPGANDAMPSMLQRVELIERIKRGNSPSWPSHHINGRRPSPEQSLEALPRPRERSTTPLLPAAELKESRRGTPDPLFDHASAGIEIERPKSALHSGDFRQDDETTSYKSSTNTPLATSPVAPWHHSFPSSAYPSTRTDPQFPPRGFSKHESRPGVRSRAASHTTHPSPFILMPPTSPLVQQSNNTDLDSSRPLSRQGSRSPERNNRRHTFSPQSFQTFKSSSMERSTSGTPAGRHFSTYRKEATFPYQAHQPRRSMTSMSQIHSYSTPQTPLMHARRPSISSDASPLQHAPMVGSYEESILRGRMSTTPSRPLDFVAKIGVLGKGNCKPNLRCPAHVTVPFPAVFYSYNSGNGRIADDSPSPYVGLIDLEHSLPTPDDSGDGVRRRRRHTVPNPNHDELDIPASPCDETVASHTKPSIRKLEKMKRRSASPKSPPGGSYRIPQQGQLQIVIKNPNKTAVKLFLVPYDLSDMEPGQKTFIRQRSYSAGPIIDMPLSSRKNLGTECPEAALSNSDDPNDRPILRYLIHLHISCPSKGRYFLYKAIRVVFANRVPDGKEKLRNEIQLPEPRYSTYKPSRDSIPLYTPSSAAIQLTADKAFRRRSAGLSLSQHGYDQLDGIGLHPPLPAPACQFTGASNITSGGYCTPTSSIGPQPLKIARLAAVDSRPVSRDRMDLDDSPLRSHASTATTSNVAGSPQSPMSGLGSPIGAAFETYDKLRRGDVGYGGNAFRGVTGSDSTATSGAGLLARRLRGLDVQTQTDKKADEEE